MTSRAQLELTAVDKSKAAFDSMNRNLQGIGQRVQTLGPLFGTLGANIAGAFSVASIGAVVALVKAQADAVDAFNDLADATGASIEGISALDSVARRSGATFDTVSTTLVKFNAVLSEAKADNDKGSVFKALGMDVERLKQLDPAEAVRQVAVALAGFADDGSKARVVQELFGKSIREVAPFLKDLAEEGQLNAKVTREQAEEAEKFNKELFRLQATITDVGRAIAHPMISGLNAMAIGLRDASKESDSFLLKLMKLRPELNLMLQLGKMLGLRGAGPAGARANDIDALLKGDPSLSPSERAALEGERTRLRAQSTETINAGAEQAEQAFWGRRSIGNVDAGKKDKPKEQDRWTGLTYDQQLSQNVGKLIEGSDVIQAKVYADTMQRLDELFFSGALNGELYDSAMKKLTKSTQTVGDASVAAKEALEELQLKRAAASAAGDAVNREADQAEELRQRIRDMSGRGTADQQGKLRGVLAEMLAKDPGAYTADELQKINEQIAQLGTTGKDSAREFGGAFSSALDDILLRSRSIGDVIKGLGANVLSIGVQQAFTKPAGDALGGWFKGLFSFDGGGHTGTGPRMGGLDGKGGFMAMLHPQETVVDHTRGGRGGMVFAPVTHITIDGTADQAATRVMVDRVVGDNNRALFEQFQRAGLVT